MAALGQPGGELDGIGAGERPERQPPHLAQPLDERAHRCRRLRTIRRRVRPLRRRDGEHLALRTDDAAEDAREIAAARNQVRDALTMLYTLPAWGAKLKDPHCGGALLDQRDDIVKAMVPIVCRNPAMLAFFTAANAPWMDYLALGQALLPVGQTIWAHHVTHTVGRTEDAGEVPVDLSHYSAPRFG